jgi:hypothetical protein
MNPNALTIMLVTELTISAFTVYYFWKVVTTPPKAEPDSYTGNDDVPR